MPTTPRGHYETVHHRHPDDSGRQWGFGPTAEHPDSYSHRNQPLSHSEEEALRRARHMEFTDATTTNYARNPGTWYSKLGNGNFLRNQNGDIIGYTSPVYAHDAALDTGTHVNPRPLFQGEQHEAYQHADGKWHVSMRATHPTYSGNPEGDALSSHTDPHEAWKAVEAADATLPPEHNGYNADGEPIRSTDHDYFHAYLHPHGHWAIRASAGNDSLVEGHEAGGHYTSWEQAHDAAQDMEDNWRHGEDEDEDEADHNGIYPHDYKPDWEPHHRGTGPLMGMENETGSKGRLSLSPVVQHVMSHLGDFAILKHDGSADRAVHDATGLHDRSFEIVTHPGTLAAHKQKWAGLLDNPHPDHIAGGVSGLGIHIHLDRKGMKPLQVGKLRYFMHHPGNEGYLDTVHGRPSNEFAKRVPDGKGVRPDNDDRYRVLSTANPHTLEFRGFQATLRPQDVHRRLEFVDAMHSFTSPRKAGIPKMENPAAFIAHVASGKERWPHLHALHQKIQMTPVDEPEKLSRDNGPLMHVVLYQSSIPKGLLSPEGTFHEGTDHYDIARSLGHGDVGDSYSRGYAHIAEAHAGHLHMSHPEGEYTGLQMAAFRRLAGDYPEASFQAKGHRVRPLKLAKPLAPPSPAPSPEPAPVTPKEPWQMTRVEHKKKDELPLQSSIPSRGTVPYVITDDGGIYAGAASDYSHVLMAKRMGIPGHRIVGGGFVQDGVIDDRGSQSANIIRFAQTESAKQRVEHKNHVQSALAAGKPVPSHVLADYPDLAAKGRLGRQEHPHPQPHPGFHGWLSPDGDWHPNANGVFGHTRTAEGLGFKSQGEAHTAGYMHVGMNADTVSGYHPTGGHTAVQVERLKSMAREGGFGAEVHQMRGNTMATKTLRLAKPGRLAALKAPAGGIVVNNQQRAGGSFLPRTFKRIRGVVDRMRGEEPAKLGRVEEPARLGKLEGPGQWTHVMETPAGTHRMDAILEPPLEGSNRDVWRVKFKATRDKEGRRLDSHRITGRAGHDAVHVMRAVSDGLSEFLKTQKPKFVKIDADKGELSRVRLYKRALPKIAEAHGYKISHEDVEGRISRHLLTREEPAKLGRVQLPETPYSEYESGDQPLAQVKGWVAHAQEHGHLEHGIFADWLQENDLHHNDDTLATMYKAQHEGTPVDYHRNKDSGKVEATEVKRGWWESGRGHPKHSVECGPGGYYQCRTFGPEGMTTGPEGLTLVGGPGAAGDGQPTPPRLIDFRGTHPHSRHDSREEGLAAARKLADDGHLRLAKKKTPVFHSHAEHILETKAPNRASAQQMLQTLLGAGVKPEELKWNGLDEMLGAAHREGVPVTKDALLAHAKANRVVLKEKVYGVKPPDEAKVAKAAEASQAALDARRAASTHLNDMLRHHEWHQADVDTHDPLNNPDAVAARWAEVYAGINGMPALSKYAKWKPGRGGATVQHGRSRYGPSTHLAPGYRVEDGHVVLENYKGKEVSRVPLLETVREDRKQKVRDAEEAYEAYQNAPLDEDKVRVESRISRHQNRIRSTKEALEALDSLSPKKAKEVQTRLTNSQVDVDAARARYAKAQAVERKAAAAHTRASKGGGSEPRFARDNLVQSGGTNHGELVLHMPGKRQFREEAHYPVDNPVVHIRHNDRVGPNGEKLLHLEEVQSDWHTMPKWERNPDTSYKQDAAGNRILRSDWVEAPHNEYHEPALKRMLRHAAENGYHGLTWTPAQVQKDRWSLVKHLSHIRHSKNEDDTYQVSAFDRKGDSVWQRDSAPYEELAKTFGHEMAKKIVAREGTTPPLARQAGLSWYPIKPDSGNLNYIRRFETQEEAEDAVRHLHPPVTPQTPRTLSGEGLKVGGKWADTLYDLKMPKTLKKMGNKWGVAPGRIIISGGHEAHHIPITEAMRNSIPKETVGQFSRVGNLASRVGDGLLASRVGRVGKGLVASRVGKGIGKAATALDSVASKADLGSQNWKGAWQAGVNTFRRGSAESGPPPIHAKWADKAINHPSVVAARVPHPGLSDQHVKNAMMSLRTQWEANPNLGSYSASHGGKTFTITRKVKPVIPGAPVAPVAPTKPVVPQKPVVPVAPKPAPVVPVPPKPVVPVTAPKPAPVVPKPTAAPKPTGIPRSVVNPKPMVDYTIGDYLKLKEAERARVGHLPMSEEHKRSIATLHAKALQDEGPIKGGTRPPSGGSVLWNNTPENQAAGRLAKRTHKESALAY